MDLSGIIPGIDLITTGARAIYQLARVPGVQRDLAGTRLREVIDEITRSFEVIEAQVVRLLQVDLTPAAVASGRNVLVELEGGSARIRMAQMRGHCSVIGRIWDEDLKGPLQKVLASNYADIERAFGYLDSADGVMLRVAAVLTDFLADEASAVLDLVDEGRIADAQLRLKQARADVRGLRRKVNETLAEMVEVRFVLEPRAPAPSV